MFIHISRHKDIVCIKIKPKIAIGWDDTINTKLIKKEILNSVISIQDIVYSKILTLEVKDDSCLSWSFYNYLIFSLQD